MFLEFVEVEVLIFSSDWCDVCDRMFAEFLVCADEFLVCGVRVCYLIIQSDGLCVCVVIVGCCALFVYHVLDLVGGGVLGDLLDVHALGHVQGSRVFLH